MPRSTFVLNCIIATAIIATTAPHDMPAAEPVRDPFQQPFHRQSIWNHPIGDGAMYVPAQLQPSRQFGLFAEEEHIILTPGAPLTPIYLSTADWHPGADRNRIDGPVLATLPIPTAYVTEPRLGSTPNAVASIVAADGRTLHQNQPFHREHPGKYATSHYLFPTTDIYGDGIGGGHGGSQICGLGGTIRLGELVPGGRIPHALKIVMHSKWYAYVRDTTPGYRWPALNADGHASSWTYRGKVPDLEMGALLALPPDFDPSRLRTEPARILATALQDYGAYACDSAGWDAYYFATEWSIDGRVIEEFTTTWGFPLVQPDLTHPWSKDIATIVSSLCVVANNAPTSIGGGGRPRRPLAAPLRPPPDTE